MRSIHRMAALALLAAFAACQETPVEPTALDAPSFDTEAQAGPSTPTSTVKVLRRCNGFNGLIWIKYTWASGSFERDHHCGESIVETPNPVVLVDVDFTAVGGCGGITSAHVPTTLKCTVNGLNEPGKPIVTVKVTFYERHGQPPR